MEDEETERISCVLVSSSSNLYISMRIYHNNGGGGGGGRTRRWLIYSLPIHLISMY